MIHSEQAFRDSGVSFRLKSETFLVLLGLDDVAVVTLLLLLPAFLLDYDVPSLVPGFVHNLEELVVL